MKTFPATWFLCAALLLTGCTLFVDSKASFLKSAEGRATQQEVEQEWGPPVMISSRPTGESRWVYEVREEEPGSRWSSSGLWCDQYVLMFDRDRVLRGWTHRTHFHGGERMPAFCVPEGK